MDSVFVIGDVHGNLDRLEALLKQEGLLVWCDECQGGGQLVTGRHPADNDFGWDYDYKDCDACKGIGQKRVRNDVTVVQLGDLGHWGEGGSPTGDLLCYKYVTENRWCDVVLWGNHDRAMVDGQHAFTGFIPDYQTAHFLSILQSEGRLQTAFDAHGFLITHAGLASSFKHQKVDPTLKTDLEAFVDWINDEDDKYLQHNPRNRDTSVMDANVAGIVNAIGSRRGGHGATGGILWRDIEENLYDGFRQIFGHSADHKEHQVRVVGKSSHSRYRKGVPIWGSESYCIDIGGKANAGREGHCLAGIWLPSEKIVEVRL